MLEDGTIPEEYTCDGNDLSPALSWRAAPVGTRSFALLMDDRDAPGGAFTHWLVWDMKAGTLELQQGEAPDGVLGTNDFDWQGYGGPCPPRGHGSHRYRFRIFAVDVDRLGLPAGSMRREFEAALVGHVLAEATVTGRCERY
ncbi:MAG: YbhB/YbcL family Raf kinase inhibitor-like protein [Planctomycetes bacterium]|nr:YbhB/YbcL family Raf kinase inhibitor-like protein [Planctomycetota bacterium]